MRRAGRGGGPCLPPAGAPPAEAVVLNASQAPQLASPLLSDTAIIAHGPGKPMAREPGGTDRRKPGTAGTGPYKLFLRRVVELGRWSGRPKGYQNYRE